jgi:hypothetical protein
MNRRDSLKYLFAASGSLVALPRSAEAFHAKEMPSWAEGWSASTVAHVSSFTPTEQEILASVADTIIPAGSSIGALSVGVDKFLQKLIDNCYDADVQQNVKKQLAALNANAQSVHQKLFSQCSQKERETQLLRFEASTEKSEVDFFKLLKSETMRGFSTSREVMLQHFKYKIAPGHYYGCVDVKA